ncbi:MAG: hypothetical protein WA865_19200 [Spirulinaceae cyanobacterium]
MVIKPILPITDNPNLQGVEFALGRLKSLETGGVSLKDLVVAISPTLDIGLLGQDVYGNYDVSIKENVIELRVR